MDTDYMKLFAVAATFTNSRGPSFVKSLCFSHCGKYLATSHTNETIDIFDVDQGIRTGHHHWTKIYGNGIVRYPSNTTDAVLLTSTKSDHHVRLLDLESYKYTRYFEGHTNEVLSLETAIGDTFVTSSKDGTVRLWDLRSNTVRSTIDQVGHSIANIDPSGGTVVVGYDSDSIQFYDARMLRQGFYSEYRVPPGFSCTWTSLKYSTNTNYLAVATNDNIVHLFDTTHGYAHTFRSRENVEKVAIDVVFSNDDKYLISGGSNGQIIGWTVETKQIAAQLKSIDQECHTSLVYHSKYSLFATASSVTKIWVPEDKSAIAENKSLN